MEFKVVNSSLALFGPQEFKFNWLGNGGPLEIKARDILGGLLPMISCTHDSLDKVVIVASSNIVLGKGVN